LVKPFIKVYIYMPPKRKARKTKAPMQTQRQSVVVNIGTKRKSSGRGRLPPPSHQHNLAPTFVTNQQIDYTPLIASILHATAKIQDPVPIRNPVTPLSATLGSAQQMAGAAALNRVAERRPGPTADNFQPLPSEADERLAADLQAKGDIEDKVAFESKKAAKAAEAAESPGASGGGAPMTLQKKQAADLISLKKKIDAAITAKVDIGKALTPAERLLANTAQIGDGRKKALVKAGVIIG
jgi:hypothetical protein